MKRRSDGPGRLRCPDMGTDTQFQTRCPVYRSGASNVQRSTLNFQRGDRKGAAWAGYGDRHGIWGDRTFWPGGPVQAPVGRSRPAEVPGDGDRHDVRYTDRERPTSNVQLSTFNEVTERAHGGRDMGTDTEFGATEPLGPVDLRKRGSGGPGRLRCPDMGTDTMSGMPIGNVQRPTFNSQLSMG